MEQRCDEHHDRVDDDGQEPRADAMPARLQEKPGEEIGAAQIARAHERGRQGGGYLPCEQSPGLRGQEIEDDERGDQEGDDPGGYPARGRQDGVIPRLAGRRSIGLSFHGILPCVYASDGYGAFTDTCYSGKEGEVQVMPDHLQAFPVVRSHYAKQPYGHVT